MEDIVWTGLKIISALIGFVIIATIWEKIRNAISARSGIGGYYNILPRPNIDDEDFGTEQLITNIERLGDFLLDRSTQQGWMSNPKVDWQWHLGEDLKHIADIARNNSSV